MGLQVKIKKPPGNKDIPLEVLEPLIGHQFSVATFTELEKGDRLDLTGSLAVDIKQVITWLSKAGKSKLAQYWRIYLDQHPTKNYLIFEVDQVDLIY